MSNNSVADVIDGSLVTLLKCMTLDYRSVVCKCRYDTEVYSPQIQLLTMQTL